MRDEDEIMSPSMRREWIEIAQPGRRGSAALRSPSMRREWIEILHDFSIPRSREVSLHAEGVD